MAMFNGGKMQHIFAFDDKTHLYAAQYHSADAERALQEGQLYYKIDGSNGMVRVVHETNQEGDAVKSTTLQAFQRFDTKMKPIPSECIAIPRHGQYAANVDTYTGHSYCYEPITVEEGMGKKLRRRNEKMLELVQQHKDVFLSFQREWISVEWVGRKFQQTQGVPYDVAIAIHRQQGLDEKDASAIQRSYKGMKSFLLQANPSIEGLVVEYESSYWKIRADAFDKKCRFKTEAGSARPPIILA